MSSAEKLTSSTVSPPADSSNSAHEEFAVEPHPVGSPGHVGADPHPADSPPPLELLEPVSPEEPEIPPEPAAADQAKFKPLPKVNAVSREVRVKAAGARPGAGPGGRELFCESTTTVLVYENGAVIRLAAAVAPGQLLFLTNEETKNQVVAQVKGKRTFRPTECYVEVEFTEPEPGFWGVQFSAATALLPKDTKETAAAALVASAEITSDEPAQALPAPNADAVHALKKEVEALRGQLKMLQSSSSPAPAVTAPIPTAPPAPVAAASPQAAAPAASIGGVAGTPLPPDKAASRGSGFTPLPSNQPAPKARFTSNSLPVDSTPEPAAPVSQPPSSAPSNSKSLALDVSPDPLQAATGQPPLHARPATDSYAPLPMPKRRSRARGQFTPAFRAALLKLGLLVVLIAALGGVAWHNHWLPWTHIPKRVASTSPAEIAPPASAASAAPAANSVGPAQANNQTAKPAPASETAPSASSASTQPVKPLPNAAAPESVPANNTASDSSSTAAGGPAFRGGPHQPATDASLPKPKPVPAVSATKHSPTRASPTKSVDSASNSTQQGAIIPPKLIKSVPAIASLSELRDFDRGDVVIDALVDPSGQVKSMSVLSGPPSLRPPAMEALKNYKYEPATLNGKPVPAHVTVKIQFRYEP